MADDTFLLFIYPLQAAAQWYSSYMPLSLCLHSALCFSGPYDKFQVLLYLCSPPPSLFFP